MTRKQIEQRTRVWQNKLGLQNWSITVSFEKVKSPFATNNFPTAAHTVSHPQYKMGSIVYNEKELRLVDDNVIVHELLHCLMSPLIATAEETSKDPDSIAYYNEMVTAEIERVLIRLNKHE